MPETREPVISLGAGVQSTTMALLAAEGVWGVVPRYAVFADTQHEPPAVMDHLDWLERELAGRVEVVRVTAGDLALAATERKYNPIPLFRRGPDGAAQMGRRQCTKEFKLYPLRHWARAQGLNSVEFWVGISLGIRAHRRPGSCIRRRANHPAPPDQPEPAS